MSRHEQPKGMPVSAGKRVMEGFDPDDGSEPGGRVTLRRNLLDLSKAELIQRVEQASRDTEHAQKYAKEQFGKKEEAVALADEAFNTMDYLIMGVVDVLSTSAGEARRYQGREATMVATMTCIRMIEHFWVGLPAFVVSMKEGGVAQDNAVDTFYRDARRRLGPTYWRLCKMAAYRPRPEYQGLFEAGEPDNTYTNESRNERVGREDTLYIWKRECQPFKNGQYYHNEIWHSDLVGEGFL